MPHIVIEYSQNMGMELDLPELARTLHDTLADAGIDKQRIKTRAIPLLHSVVGQHEPNEGQMVHITLALLEGRDIPTRQTYGQALYKALRQAVGVDFPECSLTLEVREMVKDTYIL